VFAETVKPLILGLLKSLAVKVLLDKYQTAVLVSELIVL